MKNRNVCILRFDLDTKIFRVFGSDMFRLDIVPRIGEKIVFDEREKSIIAEVIDIHYSKNGDVDIFIGKEQPYATYKSNLDINYMATLDNRIDK